MDMPDVTIDENALVSMQSLLGEHFEATLSFCHTEFDRLHSELVSSFNSDNETAIRNSHSLKSNAAQFGAVSLAEIAKNIEHLLIENKSAEAAQFLEQLEPHILATKEKMTAWLIKQ